MSIPGSASPLFLATAAAAAAPAGYQIDRSLRFNDGDTPSLSKSFGSAGNRKKWTWSGWFKIGSESQPGRFFSAGADATSRTNIFYYPRTNNLGIGFFSHVGGSIVGQAGTTAVLADHSAWYHLVFAFDAANSTTADRLKIYINGVEQSISYSVNVSNIDHHVNNNIAHYVGRGADGYSFDGYLAEVHFVDGQALAPTDFGEEDSNGVWQPTAFSGTYGSNGFYLKFADNSSKDALGTDSSGNSNTFTVTNLAVAAGALTGSRGSNYDTESSTYSEYGTVSQASSLTLPMSNPSHYEGAALRVNSGGFKAEPTHSASTEFFMACWVKFDSLVSGNQMGVNIGGNYVYFEVRSSGDVKVRHVSPGSTGQSTNTPLSTNTWHHIALSRSGNTLTGFVDGTAVITATCGNATANQSVPANSEFNFFGQSGTNYNMSGYLLDAVVYVGAGRTSNYTVPSSPLITSSGGINDVAGMSSSNRIYASPMIVVGSGAEGIDSLLDTPTNYTPASGNAGGNYATLNPLSGFGTLSNGNLDNTGSATNWRSRPGTIGMSSGKWYFEWTHNGGTAHLIGIGTSDYPQADYVGTDSQGWGYYSSNGQKYHTGSGASYGDSWATGDVIGVAFDADNGNLYFYKNGTPQNSGTAAYTGLTNGPYFPVISLNGTANTGSINFGQRPFAISSVPTGYVSLCTENLSESAYASIPDGSTAFDITTFNNSSQTSGSFTTTITPDLIITKRRGTDFTSNWTLQDIVRGYGDNKNLHPNLTVAETSTGNITGVSNKTVSYGTNSNFFDSQVAWYWDAGTSTDSNTDGNVTANVRANAAAGFSIISVPSIDSTNTIRTAGHKLNAEPYFIISKNRDFADNWFCYHKDVQTNNRQQLRLNTVDDTITSGSDLWAHTSSVIGFNGALYVASGNTDDLIFWAWAPIEGYSAFGSYEGTGSPVFVYTGMRPAWVLYKNVDADAGWQVYDSTRDPFNQCSARLQTNSNSGEDTQSAIDIVSNGFVQRATHARSNVSGNTYVYAAFAEHPFRTARAR